MKDDSENFLLFHSALPDDYIKGHEAYSLDFSPFDPSGRIFTEKYTEEEKKELLKKIEKIFKKRGKI